MLNEQTKKEIDSISLDLLKQSKSLGIFPTPVNSIISHTELSTDKGIDLGTIDPSFFENFSNLPNDGIKLLKAGLSKISGLFDRSEKIIYIDMNQNENRKNFVQLHEVGHSVLPWQSEVMLASDNDQTLNTFEDQFEAEANYFASVTLFQHDKFLEELAKLPLELNSAMALSKKFGASVHSTLRNYVLKSPNKCCLLVLTPIQDAKGNSAVCETRNLFYSDSFLSSFGELELPNEFGFKWNFVQDYKFKKKHHQQGKIELTTQHGELIDSNYHFFNNTYNQFVFIFPKGEKNKSRTKIILQEV